MNTELIRRVTAHSIETRGEAQLGDLLQRKPIWLGGHISDYDSKFLAGLLHFSGARSAVEIGVASGWSSAVMLQAMARDFPAFRMHGIDLSATFYLDKSKPTGAALGETIPNLASSFDLRTGDYGFNTIGQIGSVDFAFIDGHHMHPWATIDIISVLPYVGTGRWVAMHDLNLCTFERHQHTQRGPFYLFNMWPDQKLHSTQNPTMIGAVIIERRPVEYLPHLLEILYTPWETHLSAKVIDGFLGAVERHFGADWRGKFADCCARLNRPAP